MRSWILALSVLWVSDESTAEIVYSNFGSDDTYNDSGGWYFENSYTAVISRTHPVGEKQPNQFGLYDMHGNVWEWCENVFDANFYSSSGAGGMTPYRQRLRVPGPPGR